MEGTDYFESLLEQIDEQIGKAIANLQNLYELREDVEGNLAVCKEHNRVFGKKRLS